MNLLVAVNNFGDTRSGGLAGPMGLFIIVLMCIAVVLLIRNMNKRIRRLPDSFPEQEKDRGESEIAKLDADPGRPEPAIEGDPIDGDPSSSTARGAEAEVNAVDGRTGPAGDGSATERS